MACSLVLSSVLNIVLISVFIFTFKSLKIDLLMQQIQTLTLQVIEPLNVWINLPLLERWSQVYVITVLLVCVIGLYYTIFLSDMGLLRNRLQYAVALKGCLSQVVHIIVKYTTQEDIAILRHHMYERGAITESVVEELARLERNNASHTEQVNCMIFDASRGESIRRVMGTLGDRFKKMDAETQDRNRYKEIAEKIYNLRRKRKFVSVCI